MTVITIFSSSFKQERWRINFWKHITLTLLHKVTKVMNMFHYELYTRSEPLLLCMGVMSSDEMNVSVAYRHTIWKRDVELTTLCHANIWRLISCHHWRQVLLEIDLKLVTFTCVTSTYLSDVCSIKISLVPNCCCTNWHIQGKCVVAVSTLQGSFSLPSMCFHWCR